MSKPILKMYEEQYNYVLELNEKGDFSSQEYVNAVQTMYNLLGAHDLVTLINDEIQMSNSMVVTKNFIPKLKSKDTSKPIDYTIKDEAFSNVVIDKVIDYYSNAKKQIDSDAQLIRSMSEPEFEKYLDELKRNI